MAKRNRRAKRNVDDGSRYGELGLYDQGKSEKVKGKSGDGGGGAAGGLKGELGGEVGGEVGGEAAWEAVPSSPFPLERPRGGGDLGREFGGEPDPHADQREMSLEETLRLRVQLLSDNLQRLELELFTMHGDLRNILAALALREGKSKKVKGKSEETAAAPPSSVGPRPAQDARSAQVSRPRRMRRPQVSRCYGRRRFWETFGRAVCAWSETSAQRAARR